MIYVLIFLFLLFFSIYENIKKDKPNNKIFYFTMIFLLIFIGLRYEVGHDWNTYFHIHKMKTLHLTNGDFIEPTFTIISKFAKLISINNFISFQLLIIIYAGITIGAYTYVIKNFSKNKMTAILILFPMYILNTAFGQIRYGAALAICLLSIKYIVSKEPKKYMITILIATSFHFTAIVLLPAYFLKNLKICNKGKIIILSTAVFIGIFINPLEIISFFNDNFFKMVYLSDKIDIYKQNQGSLISLHFLISLFTYIFSEYLYNNMKIKDDTIESSINIVFLGVVLYAISNKFDILAFRGSSYYFIFEIILLPNLMWYLTKREHNIYIKNKQREKIYSWILMTFIISIAVYRLIITVFYWSDVFIPYTNFFIR